ncbi:MAG: Ldh family oxidoreductase [Candidatus Cyclobacteriaceae bacterium M3_2C_046]
MFTYDKLKQFCEQIFQQMQFSEQDAALASDVLLSADLRGVDSHGVARLSGYVRLWETGRLNARPEVRVEHETPSTAVVDGDSGVGLVVAPKAMEIAMAKAEQVGTGWVAVKDSNHYGIAGYHAMMALPEDMIGISMTNASPLVAPTFSNQRMLGTNPIAVAIPAGKEPPFVADFATTTVANGKLEILERKNAPAPFGWVQDSEGRPATDVKVLKQGGALLPLGGDRDHGSHKGYCLGSIVDIFSAVLSGANYSSWVPPFVSFLPLPENPVGAGIGHFVGAMRIDAFRTTEDFKAHMDNWIGSFRKAKTINGQEKVLIPGDPEREMTAERLKNGIPLLDPVIEDLHLLAEKFNLTF